MSELSPREFMNLYRQLSVRLVSGSLMSVDVREYRNNLAAYRDDAAHLATAGHAHCSPTIAASESRHAEHSTYYGFQEAFPQLRRALAAFARRHHVENRGGRYNFAALSPVFARDGISFSSLATLLENFGVVEIDKLRRCFTGKGSPRQIRLTLQLAEMLNVLGPAGRTLQQYADRYLGLDCNGFVQNYLSELASARGEGGNFADKGAKSYGYWAPERRRRRSMAEIRPRDILCWSPDNSRDIGHVSIIDDGNFQRVDSEGRLVCNVVESCGTANFLDHRDGLMCTQYTIRHWRNDIFQVDRGVTSDLDTSKVYISPAPTLRP